MTAISIGGGFPGGVFAPSTFLGATLGCAYGLIAAQLFPSLGITPPAFAMVGMAAVLAGTVHAPLTAIILLFEMTNDYHVILPLMFAVTTSLVISRLLERDSVYTLGLARKGIRLQHGRDVEVLEGLSVEEVMQPKVTTLVETDTLARAEELMARTRRHGLAVVDRHGELAGIISVEDIERAQAADAASTTPVGEVCTRDVQVVYPDQTLAAAMRLMAVHDIGRLPVVARDNPRSLVGILRRSDMIRAYDLAVTRRVALRHQASQVRLGAMVGVSVEEVTVAQGSACAGRRVGEIAWPRECVIATLRRGTQVLIPHGDTLLKPGDVLVAVAEGAARAELRRLCTAVETPG
jgi:CIC family chloride channel protein